MKTYLGDSVYCDPIPFSLSRMFYAHWKDSQSNPFTPSGTPMKAYDGWIQVLTANPEARLELNHDDYLFFYAK